MKVAQDLWRSVLNLHIQLVCKCFSKGTNCFVDITPKSNMGILFFKDYFWPFIAFNWQDSWGEGGALVGELEVAPNMGILKALINMLNAFPSPRNIHYLYFNVSKHALFTSPGSLLLFSFTSYLYSTSISWWYSLPPTAVSTNVYHITLVLVTIHAIQTIMGPLIKTLLYSTTSSHKLHRTCSQWP